MLGPLMGEMNFQPADFVDRLVQVVERGLTKPLVVYVGSVAWSGRRCSQRHSLVPVIYTFDLGPSGKR